MPLKEAKENTTIDRQIRFGRLHKSLHKRLLRRSHKTIGDEEGCTEEGGDPRERLELHSQKNGRL